MNRILDLRDGAARSQLRLETFQAGLADGLDPEAPERPDDRVELGELKMRCDRALLQCLDADDRVAFVLGHIFEVDATEAAEIVGVEPAAFRKRLSRARERLRAALNASCGIVNPAAPCRCHRRLRRARELGRVAPGVTTTDAPLDVAALAPRSRRRGDARGRVLPRRPARDAAAGPGAGGAGAPALGLTRRPWAVDSESVHRGR